MNSYDSIVSFTPTELNLLLSSYEERLKKKRENNKQKRRHNTDFTLEDIADLIEQKKEYLDAVVHTIKNNFSSNDTGVKKFKRDTSDDDNEDEDEKKIVSVAQKVDQYIERYSLVPTLPQILYLKISSVPTSILRIALPPTSNLKTLLFLKLRSSTTLPKTYSQTTASLLSCLC
jgi:hypothetical protein